MQDVLVLLEAVHYGLHKIDSARIAGRDVRQEHDERREILVRLLRLLRMQFQDAGEVLELGQEFLIVRFRVSLDLVLQGREGLLHLGDLFAESGQT